MRERELLRLLNSLTVQEKIAQTVQLNGDLFVDSEVMNTGPVKNLGFSNEFNLYEIGSIYNVNDVDKLRKIQKEVLEKSRHKIPLLFMSDVIYGFRTIFPIPLAQAGSYDFRLIQKAAEVSAKESYLNGLHVLFSPMLDLVRDPRWGRVMESPGEDVYTSRTFARSVVMGYQGEVSEVVPENHVAACIKHFAGYGAPEGGREYNTVDMSNQRLFNEYLRPYQEAIESHCLLVMTAFNVLNGVPSTGNKWLNRYILRERFGFEGVLVSDYAAIDELKAHGYASDDLDAARKALESGVDFDMMTAVYANSLPELVKDSHFMKLLDETVWKILELKNKLGLFENPYRGLDLENTGEILTDEAKKIATELVEKSCVLLKNNGSLPLKSEQKIAVIGPYGESRLTLGFWASVSGKPQDAVPLSDGLKKEFSEDKLFFSRGFNLFDSYEPFGPLKKAIELLNGSIEDEEELLKKALKDAQNSDVILLTFGEQFLESGEGASKTKLILPSKQVRLIKELAQLNKPIVGVLYTGRPLVLTEIEEYFDSLLLVWYPGIMGGTGIANLLSGKTSPSARLSMTFPRTEGQIPIYYAQNSTGRPLIESTHSDRFVSKYIDESNEPLYKFGEGKSYAKFKGQWGNCESKDHRINFKYELVNTSEIKANAVVHVYVHNVSASIVQPQKRLVYSHCVLVEGNGNKQLSFCLTEDDLSFFDNDGQKHFEQGEYVFYLDVMGKVDEIKLVL